MELTGIDIHKTSTPFPVDATHVSTRRRNQRLEGASLVPSNEDFLVLGENENRTEGPILVPSGGNEWHSFRENKEGATHVPSHRDQFSSFRENREGAIPVPSPSECFTGFRNRTGGAFFVPPTNERFSDCREARGSAFTVPPRSESVFGQNYRYGGPSLENPVTERNQVRINEEPDVFLPQSSPMCRQGNVLYGIKKEQERVVPSRVNNSIRKPIIRPQHYSGLSSWQDYVQHFENCAVINCWGGDQEKLIFLAASLVDAATSVLVGSHYSSYQELCAALERRFGPAQSALCKSELRARRQKRGESFQPLAEDIRRLTMLAYPDLPEAAWQSMACEVFIDSISSDETRRFMLQSTPVDLLSAVTAARQFEAIKAKERDRKR